MFNLNQLNFSSEKNNIKFNNVYVSVKIVTISLVIFAIFFVNYALRTELSTAEKYLLQNVIQTSSNLRTRMTTAIDKMSVLSSKLTVYADDYNDSEILSFLKTHISDYDYHKLFFMYPSGKTLSVQKGGKVLPMVDLSKDLRFKKALNGELLFIGTHKNSAASYGYVNEYGVPVYNKYGRIVGVLGSDVDSNAYMKILGYSNYGEKAMPYVISRSGRFIVKPSRDKDTAEALFDRKYQYINTTKEDVQELVNTKASGIFQFKYGGKKYVAAFANITGTDCNAMIMIPLNHLMLHIDRLLGGITAIIVLISTLLFSLLYYSGKLFKEHEKIIYDTAFVDKVTQDGNKNKFRLDAKNLLYTNEDSKYAMISIEIRKFKFISELYGVERADEILKDFHKIIRNNLPEQSACARDYGSTFVVLYKYEKENFIVKYFIEKLIDEINIYNEEKMQQTNAESGLVLSTKLQLIFGIYLIDDKEQSIDQMCEKANTAKSQVKEDIIKTYGFFDNSLKIKILQERIIEDEMHKALVDNQFHMYLQPKFNLHTNKLTGAEALVRWIHPTKGLIPPIDFIPLFEKNGFVIQLDKCIWEQACAFLAKRKEERKPLFPISVNVSRLHLHNDAFINELLTLTSDYEINPKYLELELTESACFNNEKRFKATIKRLKELGFTIAVDDFGTGYSSLSMLRELPFDILKLDRSFVKDAINDNKGEIVINCIVNMANNLNMVTVAEGIETEEQAALLRNIGCPIAQGYLYGKPMNTSDFETNFDVPQSINS